MKFRRRTTPAIYCQRVRLVVVLTCVPCLLTLSFFHFSSSDNNNPFNDIPSNAASSTSSILLLRESPSSTNGIEGGGTGTADDLSSISVPDELQRLSVYSKDDFKNEVGRTPPYWKERATISSGGSSENYLSRQRQQQQHALGGPCFAPDYSRSLWKGHVERAKLSSDGPLYHNKRDFGLRRRKNNHNNSANDGSLLGRERNLTDLCRPGFLIIGAGKCGTTSLYEYLTRHPRVLPATEKQIHYFKYYSRQPVEWYYAHFPTATHFLSSGALMTGEASPGYSPYPDVPHAIRSRMHDVDDGIGPKLIMIGRDPIERAYSSYRYNYVSPVISILRKGGNEAFRHVPANQTDNYYESKYLFSFEDFIRSELKVLKECILGRRGEEETRKKWGEYPWAKNEFQRRSKEGLPPIIDVIGVCYGEQVSEKVHRPQWIEMIDSNPQKVLPRARHHLTSNLIGRGLYVFPLEWWYPFFPKDDMYFFCTEDLKDLSGEPMNRLGLFLGLPSYNFSDVVSQGAYNVGGHKMHEFVSMDVINVTKLKKRGADDELPPDLKRELHEFVTPFNERLFELTGKRCNWQ